MQTSAQMLTQAAAQASAQMLTQAGMQAQQQAQLQAQQQAQAEAAVQAQLLAQQQAEEQARRQAEQQAKAEAAARAQLLAQQQAEEQARRQAEEAARAQLLAQQKAQAEAEARLLAQQQAEAQEQLKAQQQAEADRLAKQQVEAQTKLKEQQQAEAAQLLAQQRAAQEQQQATLTAPSALPTTNTLPPVQAIAINHLQAPPVQEANLLDNFIARLPSLSEAKQSFAPPESDALAANDVHMPTFSNEEASTLAAIEPAAGEQYQDTQAASPLQADTQEIAAPPAVAGEEVPVIGGEPLSHPAVKQAVQEVLSEESKRLLSAMPSAIDSPKTSKKQRVDIERDNLESSVFSELGEEFDPSADSDSVGMAIDVKRPSLDMNYELERAYNAIASGQTEIARESYMRVLGAEPNNIQALFGMGALLHRAGDLNGARMYYAKVLEQDPDHRDTLNNFLSLVAEEAPEEALAKLKTLESKNPDFSPIPAQISYIYQRLKNMPLAAQYMIKALSLSPNNLTYKYNLAVLLDRQGAREDAASFYQDLVDAYLRGESIPGNIASIQERLTFIRSNR
jgi:Flp pilus assembly protein TadD